MNRVRLILVLLLAVAVPTFAEDAQLADGTAFIFWEQSLTFTKT
jgi:hypothetical protein